MKEAEIRAVVREEIRRSLAVWIKASLEHSRQHPCGKPEDDYMAGVRALYASGETGAAPVCTCTVTHGWEPTCPQHRIVSKPAPDSDKGAGASGDRDYPRGRSNPNESDTAHAPNPASPAQGGIKDQPVAKAPDEPPACGWCKHPPEDHGERGCLHVGCTCCRPDGLPIHKEQPCPKQDQSPSVAPRSDAVMPRATTTTKDVTSAGRNSTAPIGESTPTEARSGSTNTSAPSSAAELRDTAAALRRAVMDFDNDDGDWGLVKMCVTALIEDHARLVAECEELCPCLQRNATAAITSAGTTSREALSQESPLAPSASVSPTTAAVVLDDLPTSMLANVAATFRAESNKWKERAEQAEAREEKAAGGLRRLSEAAQARLNANDSHYAHHDPTGGAGSGCPACRDSRITGEVLRSEIRQADAYLAKRDRERNQPAPPREGTL